jgi:hypothetical protein
VAVIPEEDLPPEEEDLRLDSCDDDWVEEAIVIQAPEAVVEAARAPASSPMLFVTGASIVNTAHDRQPPDSQHTGSQWGGSYGRVQEEMRSFESEDKATAGSGVVRSINTRNAIATNIPTNPYIIDIMKRTSPHTPPADEADEDVACEVDSDDGVGDTAAGLYPGNQQGVPESERLWGERLGSVEDAPAPTAPPPPTPMQSVTVGTAPGFGQRGLQGGAQQRGR